MLSNNKTHITRDMVDNAKAIILIVPGLEKHLDKYDYVASILNSYKYSVYRFNEEMTIRYYKENSNEFSNYIKEAVDLIKKENKDMPIFILSSGNEDIISSVDGIIVYSHIKNNEDIECPVLTLDVYEDELQYPIYSKLLLKNRSSKHNRFKVYKEENQDYILTDINNWIRKRLRHNKNK